MKKVLFLALVAAIAVTACQKDNIFNDTSSTSTTVDESGGKVDQEDLTDSDDNVANTTFARTISITWSENGATKSGDDNNVVSISGTQVTVNNTTTSEKVMYVLSGTCSNGFFKVYSNNKQAFKLNGLSLTNPSGAAINNQGKKRCFIIVEGTNTLADGSSYTATPADEDEKAAFFSEGQLIFSGSGSLTVTATGKAGITSDDYIRFMDAPTVKVSSSAGHGVRGKDAIYVSGGTVEASVSANMKKGFSSDSLVRFDAGSTTIKVTGSAAYDSEDKELTGTAGIKADQLVEMAGGTVVITNTGAGGKGISCDGQGKFAGGSLTVKVSGNNYGTSSNSVSAKGLKFDGNLYFSGASVIVTATAHEAIESKGGIVISGGEVYATSSTDDAINSALDMVVNGGYVYANSSGNDGMDANGDMKLSGGVVFAITTKGSPEVALDANTEQRHTLYINSGATVIAYGGLESGYSASQTVYSISASAGNWNALYNGSSFIAAFKAPSGLSNFAVSAPSLSQGYTGVSVSGSTCANGTLAASGISGGSAVSLSTYSGNGGGGNPGGGGPGGGGGRPGGGW